MSAISFVRLHPDAREPTRAHDDDAGWDLVAVEPAELAPGRRTLVSTGLAIALSPGTAGLVLPRSGLARDHGIGVLNAPGLIDAGYRGEIGVLLVNHDLAHTFIVEPGMRIAQLVLVHLAESSWVEAEDLPESTRGVGGFGSSGTAG